MTGTVEVRRTVAPGVAVPLSAEVPLITPRPGGDGWDVHVGTRHIGTIDRTQTVYTTHRDEKVHFSRVMGGPGIEISLIDLFVRGRPPVRFIDMDVLHENGKREVYRNTVMTWKLWGHIGTLSPEFGPQLFLPEEHLRPRSYTESLHQTVLGEDGYG
jgi:hypothetical protein